MHSDVEIAFDSVPLRQVGRLDVPLDASPAFRSRCERVAAAIEQFGTERTYYLENARCIYRLANSDMVGMVRFEFEGVIRTDAGDARTAAVDVDVALVAETCGGVPPEIVDWLSAMVRRAIAVEFDRYIASGNRDADVAKLQSSGDPPPDSFEGGNL